MDDQLVQLLHQLERLKLTFNSRSPKQIERLLTRIERVATPEAESLIGLHELLLFLRAYPQSAAIVNKTESLLRDFAGRVREAADREEDLSSLDHPEMSGIAGRDVVDTFGYYVVAGLVARYPRQTEFYWEWFEDENRLEKPGRVLCRCWKKMPSSKRTFLIVPGCVRLEAPRLKPPG